MRIPTNIPDFQLNEQTEVRLIYTDTEQNQKIEISVDGDADLTKLLEMFEKFLLAMGFDLPSNACVGVVTFTNGDEETDEE